MRSLIFSVALLSGCERLDKTHRPYTPFGSATPETTVPAVASGGQPSVENSPEFRPAVSVSPPGEGKTWKVSEVSANAPAGYRFVTGLVGDFSESGEESGDLVAWLSSDEHAADELWLFPEVGGGRRIFQVPGFVSTDPQCAPKRALTHLGPGVVLIDATAECPGRHLARAANRALAVLAPGRPTAKLLVLGMAADAPGETLKATTHFKDLDEDARGDVAVEFSLHAGDPATAQSAQFTWFDRAAGLAKDPREPRQSFDKLASLEVVRAPGANTSKAVPARAANARRLYGALCAEGGAPRVFAEDATPLSCGDLARALGQLVQAEVLAALKQERPRDAVAALDRLGWFGETLDPKTREALETELYKSVELRRGVHLTRTSLHPLPASGYPRYSPLRFETSGALLVLGEESVTRRFPDGTVEDVTEEFDPWPTTVLSSTGQRFLGVSFSCDASDVRILTTDRRGNHLPAIETALVAPRPGNCGGGAVPSTVEPAPLGWVGHGPTVYLGAELLGSWPKDASPAPGAPISPDGATTVSITGLGLYVQSGKTAQLWRAEGIAPSQLSDCVVSNAAETVACVYRDSAILLSK